MNRLRFQARLLAVDPIRYTPAGLSVLNIVLEHSSVVLEAGIERQLNFQCDATVLGDKAQQIAQLAPGTTLCIQGFIAPRRKNSMRFVVHIQDYSISPNNVS